MSEDYNVLLFAETGAGKSTFINACDIYLKHATLSEALDSKQIYCRIPPKFEWKGHNLNESSTEIVCVKTGSFNTYNFCYQEKNFRFIVPPSFGDTGGCLVDSENVKKTAKFLENRFSNLHAVCFILKAGQNRNDVSFQYNVKQMLSLLHKDMLENVILIYTHSSGDHFKSGSAYSGFKKVLEDVGAEISWDDRKFFVDNKCFVYLLAVNLEMDSIDVKDDYSDCWNKTRTAYLGVFDRIQTLKQRSVDEVKQVSGLRTALEDLCWQKLPQIKKTIKQCQIELQEIESTIKNCKESIEELTSKLEVTRIYVRSCPGYDNSYYHIICKNRNCEKKGIYGEDGKVCCAYCKARATFLCSKFDLSNRCKICGCSRDEHRYIYKKKLEEKERVEDPQIASHLEKENHKMSFATQSEQNLLLQLSADVKKENEIRGEIKNYIHLLKDCCFVTYSKECIEQINMEKKIKGPSTESEKYLEAYTQLYDLCRSEDNN